MARKVVAALFATTSTVMTKSPAWVIGKNPMEPSVNALVTAARKYQVLLFSVVSTIGAHTNFKFCGTRLSAIKPAIAATPTPACDSRKPSVTTR